MAIHTYSQLSLKDRQKFKKDVLDLESTLKKQKEGFELLFLKPLNDGLYAITMVLKNQITLEQFKHTVRKAQDQKEKVFDMIKFER
jgi:hypothetical protein